MLPNLNNRICDNSWKKIKTEMGNDNCGCLKALPSDKPSMNELHGWAYLPNIILHDIYTRISPADRKRASMVCKNWRQALYHPKFFRDVSFKITPRDPQRVHYFENALAPIVRNAKIKFNSLSEFSIYEVGKLLQRMSKNYSLRSLMLEPSHCHMVEPPRQYIEKCIIKTIMELSSSLEKLSLGCCEDLCQHIQQILQSDYICSNNIEVLGLASMKDDPSNYVILEIDPVMFQPYTKLKVLSVDYDYVSDSFLESLNGATQLKRLIIHIHGYWDGHPGTTNEAWEQFTLVHPGVELRLTLIHAYEAIMVLHSFILKPRMPLTHLKVFFCEEMNQTVFSLLSSWYARIFKSLWWVDSQNCTSTWNLVKRIGQENENEPDPLVMTAWLCPNLEEIVVLGYKLFEEDLVGVARLCENKLKRLEVADEDVIYSKDLYRGLSDAKVEITKVLGRPWAPLQHSEMHPVVCNPNAGDSDEYLLPIVLADLY